MGKKEKKFVCGLAITGIILSSFISLAALAEDRYSHDQASTIVVLFVGLGGFFASAICLCCLFGELPSSFHRTANTDTKVRLLVSNSCQTANTDTQVHPLVSNSGQTANKRDKVYSLPSRIEKRTVASTPVQTDQIANKRAKVHSLPSKIVRGTVSGSPVETDTMNAKQRFFNRLNHIRQNYLPGRETEQLKERIRDWQQYDLWEKEQIEKELSLLENKHEVKHVFRA